MAPVIVAVVSAPAIITSRDSALTCSSSREGEESKLSRMSEPRFVASGDLPGFGKEKRGLTFEGSRLFRLAGSCPLLYL